MLETELFDSKLMGKNMKEFYQNQGEVSAKTGKKGRKLRKNHSVETCKCFVPFVKLHWWDCPEVNKPCPIHGNILYQNVRPEKADPDQGVTVAFHPSLRTEKLIQPVKTLLAQCDPETRINFQYFSPRGFTQESLKHQTVQTSFEDLKKGASNCYFVEKKKSSVNEKTNRIKKLKECFHSSYNAMVQKYPSSTPGKPDLKEISHEESVRPWQNIRSGDTLCGQSSEISNPLGFEKLERLASEKIDSDFITITHHDKDNVINHKIFEIDPGQRLNDNPMGGFSKQPTQFAYSSFNVNNFSETKKDFGADPYEQPKEVKEVKETNQTRESRDSNTYKTTKKERVKSRHSHVSDSSGGSVYVTPFFFLPPGVELASESEVEETDSGKRNVGIQSESEVEEVESGRRNIGVQVGEGLPEVKPRLVTKYVQHNEMSDTTSEQRTNTVSLQTDPDPRTYRIKYAGYTTNYDSSEDTISEKYSYSEKIIQTNMHDNTRIDTSTTMDDSNVNTTEVQTSNRYQIKEILITRYNKSTREVASQVQSSTFELKDGGSSVTNKPIMDNPSFANKITQYPSRTDRYDPTECEGSHEGMCKYYSDGEPDRRNEEPRASAMKTNSSRTAERFKPPAEEKTSAVSDLSELKRMIYEYFERATCNCKEKEMESRKKPRVNTSTMTEDEERKDKMVIIHVQSSEQATKDKATEAVPTELIGSSKPYRQSVLLDDPNQLRANYICSFCGRRMNKFSLNAATNTESFAIKEKTTIIETDYTEIRKIKKMADPADPSKKPITKANKPTTSYGPDSTKVMKTVYAQTSPTRSNIPVPTAAIPTQTSRNERQKLQSSPWETQDWARQNSPDNSRGTQNPEKQFLFRECHCNDEHELFLSVQDTKYSPRSGNSYRTYGIEEGNSPTRPREDSKDSQKQPKRHYYAVSVNSCWPRELVSTWKSNRKGDGSPKRQKAAYEKEEIVCDTISIRNFVETEEIGETGKQNKTQKGNNCGFFRMPSSSVSQISINKGALCHSKMTKSEESVKTITKQMGCPPIKVFGEDPNDLFAVKSCHLNPITIAYRGQSCDKLFACSVCKSLMLLKGCKNDDVSYVPDPNAQWESYDKIPADEVPERQNYEKRENYDDLDEDYSEEYSNYSDMTTRTMENEYFKEKNSYSDC